MPNPVEKGAKGLGQGLTKKVGPLPVWGWAVVAVTLGGVTYFVFFRNAGSGGVAITPTTGSGTGGSGGSSGGSSSAPDTTVPASTPVSLTNPQWLEKAIPAVVQALGISADQARFYLQEYLAGGQPVGNTSAVNAFQRVVQAATQAIGALPNPALGNPNSNFFSSNATWLENARAYFGNVPGSVIQEINNLFNGQTTTISQQAADAIRAAESIIGVAPSNVGFTIARPAGPASLAQVQQLWQSAQAWLTANGGNASGINNPAVYLPFYRSAFPGLADEQLQAIQQRIKDLITAGTIDPNKPDFNVLLSEVVGVIQAGTRQAIPGGSSPAPAAPAANGNQLPAGFLFQPDSGGNRIYNPQTGEVRVPSWVDLGFGPGKSGP